MKLWLAGLLSSCSLNHLSPDDSKPAPLQPAEIELIWRWYAIWLCTVTTEKSSRGQQTRVVIQRANCALASLNSTPCALHAHSLFHLVSGCCRRPVASLAGSSARLFARRGWTGSSPKAPDLSLLSTAFSNKDSGRSSRSKPLTPGNVRSHRRLHEPDPGAAS